VLTWRHANVAIENLLADAPNLSAAHGKIVRFFSTWHIISSFLASTTCRRFY